MPGTYVRDSLEIDLLTGATLNATGSTSGDIADLSAESTDVDFHLITGTVTGTTPTLDVLLEASPESDFSADVVSLGAFDTVEDEDNVTKVLRISRIPYRYVRATADLAGTSPDFTGTQLFGRVANYHWDRSQTA